MEADALAALSIVKDLKIEANTEFGVTIDNIKTMSYLSLYYAYKVHGAIYWKQANKMIEARDAMAKVYCWWMNYANLMDANFTGIELALSANLPDWYANDQFVMKEYSDLGGQGAPMIRPEFGVERSVFQRNAIHFEFGWKQCTYHQHYKRVK